METRGPCQLYESNAVGYKRAIMAYKIRST